MNFLVGIMQQCRNTNLGGQATTEYSNKTTEGLNLRTVKWELTRNGQKANASLTKIPPIFPLQAIRNDANIPKLNLSSRHTAKGIPDDFSPFCSTMDDHQLLLYELRPDKRVSITNDGN